eukprot:scaffold388799_cov22-Prasinocladus_malaysianus.AAC.1
MCAEEPGCAFKGSELFGSCYQTNACEACTICKVGSPKNHIHLIKYIAYYLNMLQGWLLAQ